MRTLLLAAVASTLLACPERAAPAHGITLVYAKSPDGPELRATVDRRLAQLKVKATLSEDAKTLTVRVPDGDGVDRIKKTLARPAKLEFCAEEKAVASTWCDVRDADVSPERVGASCALAGASRAQVEAAATSQGDAGARLLFGGHDRVVVYASEKQCFEPRITATSIQRGDLPGLVLDFDKRSGQQFAELTQKLVQQRLLIVLDDRVQSAPVVLESITGGRASLSMGTAVTKDDLEALAAALAGGNLPPLTLESESAFGPPSLFKR